MPKLSPVHFSVLIKIFKAEGFVYSRTKGDHIILIKEGIIRPLVIPRYKEIPVFVIKTLLKTAKIDRERYFELLKKAG